MRYALITAFALALSLPAAAQAQGTKEGYTFTRVPEGHQDAMRRDPARAYVEANVAETLYHEMAHALIETMDLPIFGPEEYAADMFSVVLMNRLHSDAEVRQMVPLIAANYQWYAEIMGDHIDDLDLWDVHGPDLQRLYSLACLHYGASPETRGDLLRLVDLPDKRAETCAEEYDMVARAWGGVLDGLTTDQPGNTIVLDWVVNEDSHLARFMQSEVARLNAAMVLPERLNVSVIPCGQSNAFYDPDYDEIQICTELGTELAARAQ